MSYNKKGHYGQHSGNAKHSRVTNYNMDATKRDDEAHMQYLKEDIKYDNKHGHSDIDMTADEKHISKLAGDLKYDEKHHGAAQHHSESNTNPHGEIREAPSKLTQAFRNFKNHPFVQDIAKVAAITAPIGFIGKAKAVKNIASAFSNTPKQYLKRTTSILNPIPNSTKAYNKLQYPMGKKAFSNTPKQLIAKATRTKNVPVVGKPGQTVSVPGSSSTQQVSYANPRISMTAAERAKAGY